MYHILYNFLKNIKGEKDIPRMILFVPIKCEKYYHEGRMDEVNKEIKKQYKLLFDDFGTLPKKDLYTVAVGLMSLDETEFARFAAGSVFIAVPIVILYFFLVKDMVNGMAAGAVKG